MRKPRQRARWVALLAAALFVSVLAPTAASAKNPKHDPVDIQFLTVSDWHAQLDPLFVFDQGSFGGAAVLSAYFDAERAANPNTLTFTAGDAYGASPPLSSFFDEEPAVRAMRMMGFDADTFGNHNFDRGTDALQNLINIANAPASEEIGEPFQYVSANLKNRDANLSGVKDFKIFDVGGVKVAVIGITNPEAPTLVFPDSFGTIEVTDPVRAANKARASAKKAGAKVFVVLTHMGVTGVDVNGNETGPLIDFANAIGGYDVIVGDHTDAGFVGNINGALVVENASRGRQYARIQLTVDPHNGRVISNSAVLIDAVSSAVTPDQAIVDFLAPLRDQLTGILGTVIGQSDVFIPRTDSCGNSAGRTCESLVGNVVTDAMRARYGTDFAIMNSGGLRAALTCPTADILTDFCPAPDGGAHEITAGQVLTVLPFGNLVVTLTVTGAQLKTHLEQGVSAMPGINGRYAQVSGLCFTYDISAAAGSRVTGAVYANPDGSCSATAIDLSAGSTYTLAENDFTALGGDGYPVDFGSAATREPLDQATAAYVTTNSLITPSIQQRIKCTTSGAPACPVTLP